MNITRDISATFADFVANSNMLWKLTSKTLVRWTQYLCQERRSVEARQVVASDPRLHRIFKDAKVTGGPFQGMEYGKTSSFCSAYYPKILGTYEMELIPAINAFLDKDYRHIVDVGAAEGFYAVGFALKSPESKIIAYEQSPRARKQLGILARINGVQDTVEIRERCEQSDMMSLPTTRGLLLWIARVTRRYYWTILLLNT